VQLNWGKIAAPSGVTSLLDFVQYINSTLTPLRANVVNADTTQTRRVERIFFQLNAKQRRPIGGDSDTAAATEYIV